MTTIDFNFQLAGYHPIAELYRDAKTILYRARQVTDESGTNARLVTIAILASAYPTYQELLEFRHQYTIVKQLDLPGVVRIYSLETCDRGYVLVMEDFGGRSLTQYRHNVSGVAGGHHVEIGDVLQIAIQLADTLHALGQHQIVHKDIKPANILINPTTEQVKLINFSIASRLPRETPELLSPNLLSGTLAYLAPEQTGRMNRTIDYRTDFYGLGVTLSELLTGQLPFTDRDPIDLIHAHLDRVAVSVDRVNPDVPSILAQIVAKLMAKNAEDRYQSAVGLKSDLEKCWQQFRATGTIEEFELGGRDVCDRFMILERLYGRELAIETLLDAFERVAVGSNELVLVAGGSGIGKTAVINEVHKPMTRQHGYFIKGKFDQFNRDLPLWGFVQALRDLIGQLMSESDAQLAFWKSQLLAAVGANGRVLIEAIPELERMIGSQPPVAELSGTAAQNRFKWLFQKAIEVFTQPEHPLTIFLDDLQWADSASLESLELLMQGKGYLLILGAYRDNEVSPSHPLMLTIEKLQQAQQIVSTITLLPLTVDDIDRLVADTLRCARHKAQPLTELIDLKTQGNPFFITQFLKALHTAGEIRFNPEGYWECDILRVQALALSDDVVAFMAAQLQKLPPATQYLLKLAACIGDRFDLETLSIVSERSQLDTAAVLWRGLEAGLILLSSQVYKFDRDFQDFQDFQDYVDGGNQNSHAAESPSPPVPPSPRPLLPSTLYPLPSTPYRFLHDRVQQAAYALIPESDRQQTHLQIGRLLLANTPVQEQAEKLFVIVNHFNVAIAALSQPAERELVAELNLQAARKARAANAYAAAASYARIGTEILGKSGWTHQYQLTLALYETLADAAFLSGDFGAVPGLVQIVTHRARTPIDRVKVYETMIQFHSLQKQYPAAISRGLEILQQLGIKLSPKPDRLVLLRELVRTKIALAGKSDRQLLDLPEISDPEKIAKLRILDLLQAPAFFCSQELMAVLSLVGLRLTLRYGNTPWAASFYATYCIIISGLGELKQTYRLGQLATILADRFGELSISARIKVVAAWYTRPWQEPLRSTLPMLDESVQMATGSSNLQYIGINAGVSIASRFYAGLPLSEVVDRLPQVAALISQSKDENSQQFFDLMRQTIVNLHVPSDRPLEIFEGRDERSLIAQWQASNEAIILSTMYGFKTLLAYQFEDLPNALIAADAQLPYEYSAQGGYAIARIWLFDALTRLAVYPQSDKRCQKQLLKRIDETQRELGKRARLMPENFQHQSDLVGAEKCRVLADFTQAIELYDRAIAGAKVNEYLQEEALANELAAKFYLNWGKIKIAATYMQDAYYCYARWGAKAKTNDLERRYPHLLAPILASKQREFDSLSALVTVTNSLTEHHPHLQNATNLDLASVIQSAQALSSTIELEELIQQLSQIILKNSGAQTCILALPDRQDEWQIRSISTVGAAEKIATISLCPALVNSDEYPANLIYWVKNTQATVVFDARQPLDIPDRYLLAHQPQSVLCLPIVNQEQVLGVLYLEHRHARDIFTDTKRTVISFLCTQAASALHNAQLYESLVQRSAAIEASLDGFAILDRDRFIYLNQSHADMFGYPIDELIDRHWHCLYTPDQLQQFESTPLGAVGKCGRWRGEAIATRKDGSTFHQEVTLFLLDNSQLICICRDITDRKVMEIALRQSEERYYQLVSNVPGALYQFELMADGTGRLNYISARCAELFELSPQAVMADISLLLNLLLPADRSSFDRSIKKATQLGNAWNWEGRICTPSGQVKWIRGESRQTSTTDGAIVWEGILMDVTEQQAALRERKQAEIALRQSEERYQKLADNIPGVIYQFQLAPDGSTRYLYLSSGCSELLELSPAAVIADGNCFIEMIHPDDCAEFERKMVESARNLTPRLIEGRIVLNSGEIKWIKCASRPELQPDGAIVWDGVMLDVTAQKTAEEKLRKSQQQIEAFINNSPAAMYLKDLEGRYQLINQTCVNLSGVEAQLFLGQTDDAFFPPAIAKQIRDRDLQIIRSGAAITLEEIAIHLDGTEHIYLSTKFVLTDEMGKPYALGGVSTDITDLKQAEIALLATNQELQQATRLKDEFLAAMSHELRTPLNAILGMSEALQEQVFGTLNSRQLNSISTIEKSGEHLLSLINDILDVSKISAGKLELNIDRVSLTELCKSSLMLIKPQARDKQIQIETYLSVEPDWIFVDERRMRQVLINLLNNAVKFTPNGGKIELQARVEAAAVCDRTEGACLCFSVSDTGIGISNADRAKLFQPFIQIDSALNRKYQGTGLGLVLVKQIVELHGGYVTLDSEVGKGSCFSVLLPQTCLNLGSPSLASTSSSGITGNEIDLPQLPPIRTILLAEDNAINIDTFSTYLSVKGYQIILAQTGRQAIAMTQLHTPDLILMDIQMPDLDGTAAIESIRNQPQFDKIPIIVLTALVRGGEREQCLAAGADRYLSKPVKLSELHHAIEECLN